MKEESLNIITKTYKIHKFSSIFSGTPETPSEPILKTTDMMFLGVYLLLGTRIDFANSNRGTVAVTTRSSARTVAS
jgi:hypothetical protein